ncbi:hypothetical protein [Arthrobacter sp. B3I4]|uniref:hypothetical protein n=1 Tax=Arthrobacter sp. B3I4 TaxID=3042267 RepID=UPI0027881885|nr:hypothetical protein [Arthrobacter sp. B3I4]MDQ0754340.1 hypothetical protein [Arthrobacter sp. B3I4]
MAKKSRRQPARQSAPVRRAGKPHVRPVSVALHRDQEMGSLVALVPWHREHGAVPELSVLILLTAFFPVYAEFSGGAPVTAMDPGPIAAIVEELNKRDAAVGSFFCACLFEYVHFLRHTGRWSGGEERYRNLLRVLHRGVFQENISP